MTLSKSDTARRFGISPAAISKAVRPTGWLAAALTEDGRIDADLADALHAVRHRGETPPADPSIVPVPDSPRRAVTSDMLDADRQIKQARAALLVQQAASAERDAKVRDGALVDAAAAERAYDARITGLRDRILNVAGLIADRLAGLDDPRTIRAIIDRELRAALFDVAAPSREAA